MKEETVSLQDLKEDHLANLLLGVPEVQDSRCGVKAECCLLLEAPQRQSVQDVLLALEQLQAPQVCLRPRADRCTRAFPRDDLTSLGTFPKELEGLVTKSTSRNLSQTNPSKTVHKVGGHSQA